MFYRESNRLHHTETGCSAVAGMNIDVSAPEAFWAVVGIAVSCDGGTTMSADEIFNVASKSFAHWFAPVSVA